MFNIHILSVLSVFSIVHAAHIPSYLSQCKQSDPKLLECFKRSANMGIRDIVKGDYHYDIAPANPLRFVGPIVSRDNNQEVIVSNLQIHGLEEAKVSDVELDIEKGSFSMVLEIPSITAFANCQSILNYFGYAVPNHELLQEKLDGTSITFATNYTVREMDGERYFTKLIHKEELQARQQYNEFFRNFGIQQGHKSICQEKFPQIIEKQVGEHIDSILRAIATRVPVDNVFIP